MQSGTEPPTTPGGPDIPPPMQSASRLRLPVQSAQIRSWLARPVGRIVLAVLGVVVIGGGVGGFFLVQSLLRHSLPNDIPLPDHTSFLRSQQSSYDDLHQRTGTHGQWSFTVSNTTFEQIATFYQSQLPSNGWQHVVGEAQGGIALITAEKDGNPPRESLRITAQPYSANILLVIDLDARTG